MYIYDTNKGYHIIVSEITPLSVLSHVEHLDEQDRLSLIKYNNQNRPYFTRYNNKIYLDQLTEYSI